jgi:hypothetical protein
VNAQLSWLDRPYVRSSQTSKAAGNSVSNAEQGRQRILAYLRQTYGCTDQELQVALGMSGDYERPRRVELVCRGEVIDSKRTRKTSSGRDATVWEAA